MRGLRANGKVGRAGRGNTFLHLRRLRLQLANISSLHSYWIERMYIPMTATDTCFATDMLKIYPSN